ncbi:HAD family hydrolase [Cochlodiniinecator piscidefendens]|uniref:HAD family hydrolase n=1 Tax=Cochlodiniinecator piscidefendens TaxID=2715756 RepID=UPI00140E88C0|nr:HAD family phosphatase [Cochlodiniinecator piscidefendens]
MIHSLYHADGNTRSICSNDWMQVLSDGGFKAAIFDCDGTLVRSEHEHFASFVSAVGAQGHVMDAAWYNSRTGLDRSSILNAFAQEFQLEMSVDQAISDSISAFIQRSHNVGPIAETVALVRNLQGVLPMAVGTNAERDVALASLRAVGIVDAFDHVISISDDVRPKPTPDIFALGASSLRVAASDVIVFEDSPQGVKAGLKAGMSVIEVLDT